MKLLGLDLSLTATGWAQYDGSKVTFGVLSPKKLDGLKRLQWIRAQVLGIADGAGLVVVEDFALGARGSYVAESHGLGWLIRDTLDYLEVPYVCVPPQQLKKFIAGDQKQKDRYNKAIIIREVWRRLAIDVNDDNAADAIVLLYIGRALVGDWQPTADWQRAVLQDVRRRHAQLAERIETLCARQEVPTL